jgi:exopolysaccharide biosynthesis polyprenyl glycosylphosphotransferase
MRPSKIIALVDAVAIGIASSIFTRPSPLSATYAVVTVVVMWASGGYRPRIYYRVSTQIPALVAQVSVGTLLVSVWPDQHRLTYLEYLPLTVAAVAASRVVTYAVLRSLRRRPAHAAEALIIGADGRGCMVAEALLHHRRCGITPIGFVDSHETSPDSPLPVVTDLAHLDQVIARLGVKHVIVANPVDHDGAVTTRLWHCQARDVEVWTVPPLFDRRARAYGHSTEELWAIPFQHLRRPAQHTAARLVKRAFDFAVAAVMLVVTAPILALVAVAVGATSRGPIFFRQTRIGQNGRSFALLKFRTMMVNTDSDTVWSVRDERRMTPIGGFLRRSCMDELPQVFNVLRGDMSLVGPRPERPYFDAAFRATVDHYADRLRAPMGITGWAQIHGLRGDTSIAERTRFDNYYIEHWSLWLDVVIMARTLSALLQWMFRTEAPPSGGSELQGEHRVEQRSDPVAPSRGQVTIPANAGGNQS